MQARLSPHRAARVRPYRRAARRGASMVEAVFIISIFVSFFFGMNYFRSLYHQKLRVMQLGRAGVVAYAMDACPSGGNALAQIQPDLQTVEDSTQNASGKTSGTNPGVQPPPTSVGQSNNGHSPSDPVSGAMSSAGFGGDPIAAINLQAPASALGQTDPLTTIGFQSTVHTNAAMSCGDKQEDGDIGSALKYVSGLFDHN
jgi:hypothetical protein